MIICSQNYRYVYKKTDYFVYIILYCIERCNLNFGSRHITVGKHIDINTHFIVILKEYDTYLVEAFKLINLDMHNIIFTSKQKGP